MPSPYSPSDIESDRAGHAFRDHPSPEKSDERSRRYSNRGADLGRLTTPSPSQAHYDLVLPNLSPRQEEVAPREAWSLAEVYAQAHPGAEVLVGSGDSMLPLYRSRTVLVIERLAMVELKVGMTVVFSGELGWPVAHTLVEKTARGCRAKGLGHREPDETLVRFDNYIGAVVKAYAPDARQDTPTRWVETGNERITLNSEKRGCRECD